MTIGSFFKIFWAIFFKIWLSIKKSYFVHNHYFLFFSHKNLLKRSAVKCQTKTKYSSLNEKCTTLSEFPYGVVALYTKWVLGTKSRVMYYYFPSLLTAFSCLRCKIIHSFFFPCQIYKKMLLEQTNHQPYWPQSISRKIFKT